MNKNLKKYFYIFVIIYTLTRIMTINIKFIKNVNLFIIYKYLFNLC